MRAQKDYARCLQKADFDEFPGHSFSNWIFHSLPFPKNIGCWSIVRLRVLPKRANKLKYVKRAQTKNQG